jgi:uncharacterized protein
LIRALAFAFLLLVAGCSKEPEPVRVDEPGAPALWKVSGDNGHAWLFGTVHVLPPDTDWQTDKMDAAMRAADSLVLEASGLDDEEAVAEIFAQMGISGGQPSLASRVDPSLHALLDELDEKIPGPRSILDHMESWAAALTLAGSMSADLGLSRGSGVERILMLRFRADNKPVRGLETISQQFGYFDTLPEAEQRRLLDAILRGAKDNRETFQILLQHWMKGDADRLLRDQPDGLLASPVVREALLDGRNRAWTAKIAGMIDAGRKPFVAVGAAHVAGPGGVPALLKAAGYRVERVQ